MYLKALEIQGFKSFPEKTVLTFGEEITAIVGPNGSGKSNIADAVRWVMGEQSTRTLRGNKMEDVIFDGTARRRGVGFAEVSLILDNSDGGLPMEEREVAVTRRYYRSGESEYYINRRSCRLKDINELFMDTGLGREGYSIIGQGRIDEILSVKSADRREVFEEAAGISRFRHRKEEAERKLQRTEENLLRINDKIGELELQVEPLRQQAEKAKQYLSLRDELKGLEISLWLEQLEGIRSAAIKTSADYETASRQMEGAQGEQERLYKLEETLSEGMRQKDVEGETLREALSALEGRMGEVENTIQLLKNDKKNNSENAHRIQLELVRQEDRASSVAGQIAERQGRLERLRKDMEDNQAAIHRLHEQADEAERSAGELSEELERLRQRVQGREASAAEARQLLSALSAATQELMDRDEGLGRELLEQEERVAQARQSARSRQEELDKAVEEREQLRNVISGYRIRCQSRVRRTETVQEEYRRLQMEENNLTSRIHMLAEMEKLYEGYSKAVKLVMGEARRGGLRGIRGPVAGLIHVPDRCAVAIETALGSAMQNMVVERDEDGKEAIRWLKRRDGGRATFLPMNTIRPAHFKDGVVEGEPGFVGMGDALIQFDEQYSHIFSWLLGRVVVAEDMDAALAIARKFGYRFRIVTLDGQVINAGGSMTGGSASRSAGILSRANELERLNKQKTALSEDMKGAAVKLAEARREQTAAEYELEIAANQLREAEDGVLRREGQAASARSALSQLESHAQGLSTERERLRTRMAENDDATTQARAQIARMEGDSQSLRAEGESISQGRSALRERLAEINREISLHNANLAGLEGERVALEQSITELERLREELSGDTESRQAMIAQFQGENQRIDRRILQEEEGLEELRAQKRAQGEAVRRVNQEKLELEGQRARNTRALRDKNEELMRLQGELSVLERKRAAGVMEEKQLLDKLWEGYELSHEAAKGLRVELESLPKAQRRVGELKRGISALGSINPDAVEQFRQVNERYTYFTGQRDDVERSKKELEEIIAQIIREMTGIFREEFAKVNDAFQNTFTELFRGGKASLELDNPEDILGCGIEIKVQPPGKALKTISLLSGGERAFVAIALYFAILKVRPTPFCVMDEIEAALDDTNVIRFAQYLRQMNGQTQFIVITHRRGTMEEADVLYGVTMQEQGVSRMLAINLNEVERELGLS